MVNFILGEFHLYKKYKLKNTASARCHSAHSAVVHVGLTILSHHPFQPLFPPGPLKQDLLLRPKQ